MPEKAIYVLVGSRVGHSFPEERSGRLTVIQRYLKGKPRKVLYEQNQSM